MNKFYLMTFVMFTSNSIFAMDSSQNPITEENCTYVLKALNQESEDNSLQSTYEILKKRLSDEGITDYASAAAHGRKNEIFESPEEFSTAMRNLFIKNEDDICPKTEKDYQALIFNSSGIDVFMERLAFLSRLFKQGRDIKADRLYALVGTHAHRKDLINLDYLLKLPHLFDKDFTLENFDENEAKKHITQACKKAEWQHRDGMALAWKLVSCDKDMANLAEKFECYDGDSSVGLPTEQLLESFVSSLENPIDPQHPIAFITNCQGATQVKALVSKHFPDNNSVDIFTAKPAQDAIEGALFNDSPQQRAMTKLFHFYRVLESAVNSL